MQYKAVNDFKMGQIFVRFHEIENGKYVIIKVMKGTNCIGL